jgi:transposase
VDKDFIAVMRYSFGLGHDWEVSKTLMDEQNQQIDVYISELGGALICPETGELGTLYDHQIKRAWRHLDVLEFKCFIHCWVPRIRSSADVKTVETPWVDASSQFTHAFERWTIDLLEATKIQTRTAKLFRWGFDVFSWILHRSVLRGQQQRSLAGVEHSSVDEKAIRRGHTYTTIVSDSELSVVFDVSEGRDKVGTKSLLDRFLRNPEATIETITTDMWNAYIAVVKEDFPAANLIHDRFHLVRYLNHGIDQVHRWKVRKHTELKHSRHALLNNRDNRTQKQEGVFKVIFGCDPFTEAKKSMEIWLACVKETAIKEILRMAEMFKRHVQGVCDALDYEQSTARAEQINRTIQEVKTAGRGFRKFENFRSAILFFCSGLNLHPQHSR